MCWPATPGAEACPGWLVHQSSLCYRKLIFPLSQQVSIANRYLVRGGTLCPHPLSVLGFWRNHFLMIGHPFWSLLSSPSYDVHVHSERTHPTGSCASAELSPRLESSSPSSRTISSLLPRILGSTDAVSQIPMST